MSFIHGGNNNTNIANVDSNYALVVNPQTTKSNSGFLVNTVEVDIGEITNSRLTISPKVSFEKRLKVGVDALLFQLNCEGAVVPQSFLSQTLTTMTVNNLIGFMVINSGDSTAANAVANLRTYRTFPFYGICPTYAEFWIREASSKAVYAISEWGFGYASTTTPPTDGAFFRRFSGGTLGCVICVNSQETILYVDEQNIPARDGVGEYHAEDCNHYVVSVDGNKTLFWINDALVASVSNKSLSVLPFSSQSQPVFLRVYNNAMVTSLPRRLEVGFLTVSLGSAYINKPWGQIMCGSGYTSNQVQLGTASGQTANWANSAAPASASLSNTTAGYTTLGGQWQFAATATNETDWALFGYQNISGSPTLAGKTLYITGIRIGETFVTGAAGVNATTFFWSAGVSSSAVSLATNDGATTISPRRVALGSQSFIAGAAVGTQASGFFVDFSQAPLVVPASCFFHIIIKQLNGAATASLVFRGTVTVTGYFE